MPRQIDPEGREARQLTRTVNLRGQRVLEIGCGDGRLTALYATDSAGVLGVDIKTQDLAVARRSMPAGAGVEFVVANTQLLPIASASIDVVIFARSL